ncbi:MAG: glycosyltransferase family 2 protein [Bacilli bacterium]|nr:glycosyltransferase family 2 protein [Bacilli bacterium]
MEKNELISIIIPVYNVEQYLKRCIDSVTSQTYKNIEILLIDDGSTDNSGQLCDDLSKTDNRIKVYHKKNGGLSSARNMGLKKIKGKYVYFLDSDDTIDLNCIEEMYNAAIANQCDIVITPYINIKDGKEKQYFKIMNSKVMDIKAALKEMLLSNYFDVSACGKLYKINVVNNIEFPIGMLCEDNGTTYKFVMNTKKVYYLNKTFYKYYVNSNSIMTGSFNFKKYDLIILTDTMCKDVEEKYKELSDACFRRKVYARLSFLRQALTSKNVNKKDDRIIESKTFIKTNYRRIMSGNVIPRRDKIASLTLMLGNGFYSFAWKVYTKIR